MRIESLRLLEFRNIEKVFLNFNSDVVIFVGQNGQGKSNLLEGLHLALSGHSFRPSKTEHFLRTEQNSKVSASTAGISCQVKKQSVENQVEVVIQRSKVIKLNKKRMSASRMNELFPLVMFSPESLTAIKGGPEQRRKLLDEVLISTHPQAAKTLTDWTRAMKSRNRVLRDFSEGKLTQSKANALLESLNPNFFRLANEVTLSRLKALQEITPLMNEAMRDISEGQDVETSVDYVISEQIFNEENKDQILNAMLLRSEKLHMAELASGTSLIGPHKHDIRIKYGGQDARYYCSQGQQRALILAFKISQMVYHYRLHNSRPILFLDDVFSELDETKRRYLVEFLKKVEAQTFLTTTEVNFGENFSDQSVQVFQIKNGKVITDEEVVLV